MGDVSYEGSGLQQWLDAAEHNPAAPAGLNQTVQAANGQSRGEPSFANSSLGQWANENGLVATSNSWYTGANSAGTWNGWDNDFVQSTFNPETGLDAAAKAGTLATYFADGGTGVVTWDHESPDGRHAYAFGDIVEKGQVVGNVYDLYGEDAANLSLLPWLGVAGATQAKLFTADDPAAAIRGKVTELREQNTKQAAQALEAKAFEGKVEDRAEDVAETNLTPLGAAVGTATVAAGTAAALTSWTGPGVAISTPIAAAGGFVAGLVGGLLNKDELDEQAARAYEITALSTEEHGLAGGILTGAEQWAGFSTHLTSPLTNVVHGAFDSERGDHKSGFYAVDDKGERTRPVWAEALSLGAAVGDGVMQFASPLARGVYTAQMGTQIAGASGALIASGGEQFNPRSGSYDNIFLDDEGNLDLVSGAAGIMNIGIDAIQLGGWRALAGATAARTAATQAGERSLELAGRKFVIDEATGKAVSARKTWSLLAPSEQVAFTSATRMARVAAQGRAVTADDLYRAANKLSNGSNVLKAAVVNGFGEGYEEVAQSVLEPISMDGKLSFHDMANAFFYGAAGGVGMGLGATAGAATNDQRLAAQAFSLEQLRSDEPLDWESFQTEWAELSDTEKRVRASRTEADAQLTRQALGRISESMGATMVASDLDVAKALDAQRTMVERALQRATGRTDAYHVMAGLDAGRVDATGAPTETTAPAEAVEGSAMTIYRLLEGRLKGIGIQRDYLTERLAALAGDPEAAEELAQTQQLLANAELTVRVGEGILNNLAAELDAVYNADAAEAEGRIRQVNTSLEQLFRGTADLRLPEDLAVSAADARMAGMQFATLLASREPKLDSGSYLGLLPRISWKLTVENADNFLQVNTDVLASINGDFDGDKLRAENQLILSPERFAQVRAGALLGGTAESIDIAERNFEAPLVDAVATGLRGTGQLRDEAEAMLATIGATIARRYTEISPDALSRALGEFRTAVAAGSGSARLTLLNALAREAGQAITDRGTAELHNEWLWLGKVVLANFEAYQADYRKLLDQDTAPTAMVELADFTANPGTNVRKQRAVSDAQTLALFAVGNTLFRKFQKIHYSWYNAAVLEAARAEPADLTEMAAFYEELSRYVTRSELARVEARDTVAARVLVMLRALVDDAMADPDMAGKIDPATALTVLANVKVKDVWWEGDTAVTDGKPLSLVQVLLKRALDAEREEHFKTWAIDDALQAKHRRLRAMTLPADAEDPVRAERAFLEVFGAMPFQHSLKGVTGALAPHTTPEQWLRAYVGQDAVARQQTERLFKNVPEYLDREQDSNLPYSLSEASHGGITPYRSMLDAMMAVGRAELTFDPTKPPSQSLGGRRAQQSRRAMADFTTAHQLVREALADFRKITNRRVKDHDLTAAVVQQMFEANPQFGRQVLDSIPAAAANALFEARGNQLYIAPWIYETFAIANSEEALAHYWVNLTLTQWAATQSQVHEDDSDAPGRAYNKLQSRFQRLLYQLAKEPGQPRLEALVRKMAATKSLDELFHWVNTTPGMRGADQQGPLVPFVDDVADFDPEVGGAWSTARASGDLRTAIATMRRGAEQLRDTMRFREVTAATDRAILDGIKRARYDEASATPLDREHLRKLQRALAVSLELPRGFGPSAMLALGRGVLRGFDANSHDKGKTAASYGPLGEFQALMDAFAFVPGLERVMETLTAHSIGSLRSNIGDIAKHSGVAMDANGRPVEWEQLDVDTVIEMLDDSRTAPLALALLTPSALDLSPNGTMAERLLTEASLKDLLDDEHYRELFREDDGMPVDRALRYVWMVDAKARAEGGNFDALRAVHDLAISRTSSLGRPATEDDNDRLLKQAYVEVAEVLQLVGRVQGSPALREAGTLSRLRETAVKELRAQRMARSLPGFTEGGVVVPEFVESMLAGLAEERDVLKAALVESVEGEELEQRSAALDAQYEANEQRIRALLEDDLVGQVVARFELTGDDTADTAVRAQIVAYVRSMADFPARAPEAGAAWSKLAGYLQAGRPPELTTEEWAALSRGAMGVTLVDQVLSVASHVSLPPFPKGDPATSDARFYKYFDPTFSYLATDLLAEDSPLAAAAQWLHQMADQPTGEMALDEAAAVLRRTVLNRTQLGTWTPGLMSQLVETHTRMDSAAAAAGASMPGNGPKRMAAIAAATRRTGKVPPAELLTTVTFSVDQLEDLGSLIPVLPAGAAEPTTMSVAALDNRFVAAVRVDGEPLDLEADNLGYRWDGAEEANPYRYVSLARLRTALGRHPGTSIEIDLFHPDSQPAGPEWFNNAFFEGMSHSLLPDGSESLLASLWSDNGGLVALYTQRSLDAGKKGLRAIQPFRRLPATARLDAEAEWTERHDFAAMLRAKTQLLLGYDDGSGTVAPEAFNALYKHMKLAHILVGTDGGQPRAMTAEEVIAFQAANGHAAPLPLEGARLVQLSPDVIRTMLGETGDQGVPRFFADDYLVNPDQVPAYTGITQQMLERFGAGWVAETARVGDTSLANVGAQRALRVRTVLTAQERDARQQRIQFLEAQRAKVQAARFDKLPEATRSSYADVLRLAAGAISTERATFDFAAAGVPIAPRDTEETKHSLRLVEALNGRRERSSYERGWRVVDQGGPNWPGGVLTVEQLDNDRPLEHHLVKDDLVLVELATFDRPERDPRHERARLDKALRYLVNTGATVVLGPDSGRGDLRYYGAQVLQSLGYTPVLGSRHLFEPVETSARTQNERAYESTLTETRRIRPARNAVTFLASDPIGTDENDAILNEASWKLRDRKALSNVLPSAGLFDYNLPLDDNLDNGLYARTLAHLRTVTTPGSAERAHLVEMAGADPARVMPIADALDRFHARITNTSSLTPEPGTELLVGDIVPFVHPAGRVVLYRHGMRLPRYEDLATLQAVGDLNVALAPSELEAAATANSGIVQALEDRAGYGRTLVLESPLQRYGNKLQLEWNGMKYVVRPAAAGSPLAAPPPLFANGTVVDLLSDVASANSKEAFEGRINHYRNALAFFQYDFTDDLVAFFFPGQESDPAARTLTYNLLHRLANQTDYTIPLDAAAELAHANVALADLLAPFAQAEADRGVDPSWTTRLIDAQASAQIAQAVVLYLLTPGAHVDNVLRSEGFSHPRAADDNVRTRLVPGLFATLLDHGLDSALHAELTRRFDAQFYRGPDGSGFRLNPDWSVSMTSADGTVTRGFLQFGEAHSSGDNPLLDGQAFNLAEDQDVSAHNAMAAASSIGAITAHRVLRKSRAFAKGFAKGGGVAKLASGDSVWKMLTTLPDEPDASLLGWRRETPAETARRVGARRELVGYYQPLNRDGWTEEERSAYQSQALAVLDTLNLYGSQVAMVDTWVRQQLGRPHGIDELGNERGVITGRDALEIVTSILHSVRSGLLPTAGAAVPLLDVNHLTTIYLANLNRPDGRRWTPVDTDTKLPVQSWDGWVEFSFGTAFDPEARFDELYLLAVDGMMHGYQGATASTRYLPVSSNMLRQHQLMDPETNKLLVSVSEDMNLQASDPTLFNTSAAELESIILGIRTYADVRGEPDPSSAKGYQAKRVSRWRKEVDAPRQTRTTMRGVRSAGQNFIGQTTTTSAFFRSWMNLRVGNVLLNAVLIAYAPLDAFYRRTMNTLANAAVGQGTGALSQAQVRLSESFEDRKIGTVAKWLGVQPTYTSDELVRMNNLVDALSARPEFKAMIYKELSFRYPSVPGIGRVEKALERYAKFGAKLQDPAYGMLPKDLARIYLETTMRRIATDPTGENLYSVDTLIRELTRNPEWLERNDLETHNMALAAIAQIRSVKPNIVSLAFRGALTPLAESSRFGLNAVGNMLQVLTAFQNFWSGFAINITGLQGAFDFAAMMVDGRQKNLTARMQAAIRGERYNPDEAEYFDMSAALEGLDLADSFIRGGITHASLFAAGMLAGGLGLSGDDEEEKFRRRQAELQGAGFIADPRKLQYDFRNRDAIFLDWLPFGLDSLFKTEGGRSLAQMNWVLRTYLSPIIGFERFYASGDFSDVIAGFGDAIGSHPIVNTQLWNSATDTAAALHNEANDLAGTGREDDKIAAGHMLMTAVGVLERTVLENSMANMIYAGVDRYDRDPYALAKRDSDGNVQVDVRGNPVPVDALQPYRDPETGEVKQGYYDRDSYGAQLRVLTENRFGLALFGSLFSGLAGHGFLTGSDLFRGNMVPKIRQVELQPMDQREAEGLLLGRFLGEMADGGQYPLLTESEAAQRIWNAKPEDAWWEPEWVEKQARLMVAQQGVAALSFIDEDGREKLTKEGARAIFEGLYAGTVTLKPVANGQFTFTNQTSSLDGVFIDPDMREEILADFMRDLQREGQELGLTQQQAASRMKRIVFGPFDDPEAREGSLYNVVWSDQIPMTDTLKYNQLNTTYVIGPNGYPMATNFTRDGVMGALGLKPLNPMRGSGDTGLSQDGRGNAVDEVAGINTGMRGLERRPDSFEITSVEEEIRAAAEKIADEIGQLDLGQLQQDKKTSGSSGYGGWGWGGYGGGGGGGYSGGGGYFTRMYALPFVNAPYGNDIPFINTSNPYVRRATIRRERVWSERGRLNQWQ